MNSSSQSKNENPNKKINGGNSAMISICAFIVDKRNLFFLIYIIAIIFSLIMARDVKVENKLSEYLSKDTETRRGLDLMDEEFTTFGTAKVMVANVSYDQALGLYNQIKQMDGVSSVTFTDDADQDDEDDDEIESAEDFAEHYTNGSALYDVTFDYDEDDPRALESLNKLESQLSEYNIYVNTSMGDQDAEAINKEMQRIIIIVAIVVVSILLLTSRTYGEVPVLLLTFIASAIIAKGTNFVYDKISFISDSVAIVLQLAMSIDYAIIYVNRFKEERKTLPVRESAIVALSKAIPEISSSSLTTIGGLVALTFMQYGIGPDMGIVLIKAIVFSLLSVFTLMPGLLMLFANLMEKTEHRNFVPNIPFVGKFAYHTRKIIPPLFVVLIAGGAIVSNMCPYVYGYSNLTTPLMNETQIAEKMIEDNFGKDNYVALVVPGHDYEKERALINALEAQSEVKDITALASKEAKNGYTVTQPVTPRQFSELADVDYTLSSLLFSAYAADNEEYGRLIGGVSGYRVSLMDMFLFLHDKVDEGYVTLSDDQQADLDDMYDQLIDGRDQLQGKDYDRMLVYLNLPEESTETFHFLDRMHTIASGYYGDDEIFVVGDSSSEYDLQKSFQRDNIVVSVVSILLVLIILLFTFKSAGMPVLLIAVIQGSIFINFSFPYLMHQNLFFLSYLIVSSIQMGANIDYAIVISSRYMENRGKNMDREAAIIDTMNFAFPTIITSGLMMTIAGFVIGQLTSNAAIAGVGQCLGRGTLLSIILVMFVLPQILILGDRVIAKTAFEITTPVWSRQEKGFVYVNGRIHGTVNGTVIGTMRAMVRGSVSAIVETGDLTKKEDGTPPELEAADDKEVNEGKEGQS